MENTELKDELLTLDDIATALHLEKHTASKIMKQMNYIKITERIILVSRTEFQRYLTEKTIKAEA